MLKQPSLLALAASIALITTACDSNSTYEHTSPRVSYAVATLHPTKDNVARGIVSFTETIDGIKIEADVFNLTPGAHGFHIHEWGDCSSTDGSACGGHFNPEGVDHGSPNAHGHRHVGDLGNLTADDSGYAHYQRTDKLLKLSGETGVVGRSIIVHAGEDDLKSQPSGNAGPRIAQGAIGIGKN